MGAKLKFQKPACLSAVVLLGLSFGVSSASAAPNQNDAVFEALDRVQESESSVVADPLEGNASVQIGAAGEALLVEAAGNIIVLPSSTSSDLKYTDSDGIEISVELPTGEDAVAVAPISAGVVGYDNKDGSHTVPVVKEDGSVQVTTVIDEASAPTTYDYDFDLPIGVSLQVEGKDVFFLKSDGTIVGGVAPAWAVDANGNEVDTYYEVVGNVLRQIVNHHEGVAYPVVADPLWGTDLIQSATWINRGGLVSLSAVPTGWNRFNTQFGPAITQGWSELIAKTPYAYLNGRNYTPTVANTTQMYWQYNCHQVLAFTKSAWNLEPSRYRSSYLGYTTNRCN